MPKKLHLIQSSFVTGEISPRLYGRVDVKNYNSGLKQCTNFIVYPHGGLTRRDGLHYVAEVKDSSRKARLIPFEFGDEYAYILEFGHENIRVYRNNTVQVLSGDGVTPVDIISPFDEDDIFGIQYAQSFDVIYLAHPGYKPRKLTRTAHDAWALSTWAPDEGDDPFAGVNDYPRSVATWQQRLFWAGTNNYPQTVWASGLGNFGDFDLVDATEDDDPIQFTVDSNSLNVIQWILPGTSMLLGTSRAEFQADGGGRGTPITPTTISVIPTTEYGCTSIRPIRAENTVLFVQRAGKKIRELAYNFDEDNYIAPNVTIYAEHLTETGIVDFAYQQEPDSLLWCILDDGDIASMTYEKGHKVYAWHHHTTDGDFESTATIPHPDGGEDQVWFVVKRNINNVDYRFVEYMDDTLNTDAAWIQTDGSGFTSVSGIDHLAYETVDIVGLTLSGTNMCQLAEQAVGADGSLTLEKEMRYLEVGLPYTSTARTLNPELLDMGTIQSYKKKIVNVHVRMLETPTLTINGKPVPFRTANDQMDDGIEPYTGMKKVNVRSSSANVYTPGWSRDLSISIQQLEPFNCSILALTWEVGLGD